MEARVTFSVLAQTDFGDSVLIVGNCPSLGCWDPSKGVVMTTDAESYPHWRTSPMFFSHEVVEYKYLRRKSNGDIVWENCGFRNRQAIVEKNKEYLVNDKMDVENSTEVKMIPTVVNIQPIVIPVANPVIEVPLSLDPTSQTFNEPKVEENVIEKNGFAESIPRIEVKKENIDNHVDLTIPVDKAVLKNDSNLMSNDTSSLKYHHPLSLSEPTIHQLSSVYYKSSKSEPQVPLITLDDGAPYEDQSDYQIPKTPTSPKSKSTSKTYTPVIHQKFSKSYPFLHSKNQFTDVSEFSPQRSFSTSNPPRLSNSAQKTKQKEVIDCELPVVDFKEYQFPDRYMTRITEQSGLTKLSSQIAEVNILIVQDYSKSNFTTEQEMNQHMAHYENFPMTRIWQVKYLPKPITVYIPFSKENVSAILKAIAFTPKHESENKSNLLDASRLLYPGLTKINDKANPLLWKARYTASFICLDPHFIQNGFGPQGFPEIQNTLPQMFYDRYGITPPKIVQEKGKYKISFFTVYCCWKKGPSIKGIGNPLLAAPPYELHHVSVVVGPQDNFQVIDDKLLDKVDGNIDWWPEPSLYGTEQGYPAYGPKPELGAGDHHYQIYQVFNNNQAVKSNPGN